MISINNLMEGMIFSNKITVPEDEIPFIIDGLQKCNTSIVEYKKRVKRKGYSEDNAAIEISIKIDPIYKSMTFDKNSDKRGKIHITFSLIDANDVLNLGHFKPFDVIEVSGHNKTLVRNI